MNLTNMTPEEGRKLLITTVRDWLAATVRLQEVQNDMVTLESRIKELADSDSGGPCDVYWPLVYGNVALDWKDGRLTVKRVERLD